MIIYKITNLINGKIYIGRTIKTLKQRWAVHLAHTRYKYPRGCPYVQRAIAKYGYQNFKIEQIDSTDNFSDLKLKETYHIKSSQSYKPQIGYNLTVDSCGGEPIKISNWNNKRIKRGRILHTRKRNTELIGVYYSNNDGKHSKNPWQIYICYLGKKYTKRFANKNIAILARDKLALFLYGKHALLNRPNLISRYKRIQLKAFFLKTTQKNCPKSYYRNVSFCSKTNKWIARIKNGNMRLYLGGYDSENEAAIMVDKMELFINGERAKLNFPDRIEEYRKEDLSALYSYFKTRIKTIAKQTTSKFRGVNRHGQCQSVWCWGISFNKSKIRGTARSENEAAKLYDLKAVEILGTRAKTNFPINNYL